MKSIKKAAEILFFAVAVCGCQTTMDQLAGLGQHSIKKDAYTGATVVSVSPLYVGGTNLKISGSWFSDKPDSVYITAHVRGIKNVNDMAIKADNVEVFSGKSIGQTEYPEYETPKFQTPYNQISAITGPAQTPEGFSHNQFVMPLSSLEKIASSSEVKIKAGDVLVIDAPTRQFSTFYKEMITFKSNIDGFKTGALKPTE